MPSPRAHPRRFAALLLCALCASAAGAAPDPAAMSLEQLLDVRVVAGSKYEQPLRAVAASASVITRDDIRTFGWRTLDAALASLPGFHGSYDRQYVRAGVRGFALPGDVNTRLLVTIDGQRTNDGVYTAALVGRDLPLDMDLVERIEVIPGPGGAVYGRNAMFAVVNVITRTGASVDGGEAAIGYGHAQRRVEGRATWGWRLNDGTDLLLSVSGLRARGADLPMAFSSPAPGSAVLEGTAAGLDGERDVEFFASARRGPWHASAVYGWRRKDDPTAAYFSDPLADGQYERDAFGTAFLGYAAKPAPDLDVLARVNVSTYRYFAEYRYDGVRFPSQSFGDTLGGELRLMSGAVRDHTLMLGIEAQVDWRADQTTEDDSQPGSRVVLPGRSAHAGVYAQDEWRIAESLTATLGARLDYERHAGWHGSPRAALIWQAGAGTLLKALYGRAGRAPNVYERTFSDGQSQVTNTALDAERVDAWELVADQRLGAGLDVRASLYSWTIDDAIALGFDAETGLTQYQSHGRARSRGGELAFARAWARDVRLRGSVSWQDVRAANGIRLPNAPRLLGKLLLSAPLPGGLTLGAQWIYTGPRLSLDGGRVGSAAVADVNLTARGWLPGLEASLSVSNVFDKAYLHPATGANWQMALQQDGRVVSLRLVQSF